MEIRRATEADLELVYEYIGDSLSEGTMGAVPSDQERAYELLEPELNKGSYILVAMDGDKLMAWVLLGKRRDFFSQQEYGYVLELYTVPSYRRQGVAKQLLLASMRDLQDAGFEEVRLNVFASNPARALYRSLGFEDRTMVMAKNLKEKP